MARILRKIRYPGMVLVLLSAVLLILPGTSFGAQPAVGLGTTSSFAVLSGQAISNTGQTTISGSGGGDVGVSPGSSLTGWGTVTQSGVTHLADAVALQAQTDLTTAYNDAAGRTPVTTIPTELGNTTLTPGVYTSQSGTFEITGTLTLDAQGDPNAVFIFQTSSTLVTASSSNINLVNSTLPCRVFWKVGSSATLGTNSHFVGHLFALTSITATTGATVHGQLLARNGSVTLDTNTITNDLCTISPLPAISVSKSADPSTLTAGAGTVTYTYTVTNPGTLALSNVTVTDDKVSPLVHVSGDTNADGLLQPDEAWVYTGTGYLDVTTTNTATASGSANGVTATDTASVTVPVSGTPGGTTGGMPPGSRTPTSTTIRGGELPNTATTWYNILLLGSVITIAGGFGCWRTFMTRKACK